MEENKINELIQSFEDLSIYILNSNNLDKEYIIVKQEEISLLLSEPYKNRFLALDIVNELKYAEVLILDQIYKVEHITAKTIEELKIQKLLQARECDEDFELSLANMITGDNDKFPYRSSYYLTQFFKQLGLNEIHDKTTRRFWVQNVLKSYPITIIYKIITQGLFRKRYFIDSNKDINAAIKDFENMLTYSFEANELCDISRAFGLNINSDLLFNNVVKSKDITLNILIEECREQYISGNKQVAIEKIWDALERIKTILDQDKKNGIKLLCEKCATSLDKSFFDNEFNILTKIGNTYQIRHFETDKTPIIDDNTLIYLFFRAFSLAMFSIKKLEE